MTRCVRSRGERGSSVELASLLSTLVTVARLSGDDGKWQYSFYNVRRRPNEFVNLRVTSKTELPAIYQNGFTLGCGLTINIDRLSALSGISFGEVEEIGDLATAVRKERNGHPSIVHLISLLELYGMPIESLVPLLQDIECLWAAGHGQEQPASSSPSFYQCCVDKAARYPRPPHPGGNAYKLIDATEGMLREHFEASKPGQQLRLDERSQMIAAFGDVGSGELRNILHPPPEEMRTSLVMFRAERLRALNLPAFGFSNELGRVRIPLSAMNDPLGFLQKIQQGRDSLAEAPENISPVEDRVKYTKRSRFAAALKGAPFYYAAHPAPVPLPEPTEDNAGTATIPYHLIPLPGEQYPFEYITADVSKPLAEMLIANNALEEQQVSRAGGMGAFYHSRLQQPY